MKEYLVHASLPSKMLLSYHIITYCLNPEDHMNFHRYENLSLASDTP